MLCTTATNTSNTIRTQTGAAVSLIQNEYGEVVHRRYRPLQAAAWFGAVRAVQRQGERDRRAGVYRAAGVDGQQLGGDGELPGRLDQQQAVVPRVREVADRRRRQRHVDHLPVERAATVLAARGRIDV